MALYDHLLCLKRAKNATLVKSFDWQRIYIFCLSGVVYID